MRAQPGDALRMEGMGAWNGGADLCSLRALRFLLAGHREGRKE